MDKKIAVIGLGRVGKAFSEYVSNVYEVVGYDPKEHDSYPSQEIDSCELGVVCVPTPMLPDGRCDTSIVESAVEKLQCPLILIKSTVAPGTTDYLREKYGKRICFSPEYIGESAYHNPIYKSMEDVPFLIVGGDETDASAIFEVLELAAGPHCHYFRCTAIEAELIKYMENSFFATKVAFVNEFYNIAKLFGANWHTVREGWLLDERIGRSFSAAFAQSRGFSGKCLPKDLSAIIQASINRGHTPNILLNIQNFNAEITKN